MLKDLQESFFLVNVRYATFLVKVLLTQKGLVLIQATSCSLLARPLHLVSEMIFLYLQYKKNNNTSFFCMLLNEYITRSTNYVQII